MKLKILLIDDEELTTMALSKILNRIPERYEVIGTAQNGADALKLLEILRPDVVIVDIRMPVLDGIGFLEELKKRGYSLYSIILSAYRDFEYAQQALHYGANDYLLKPLSREKLLEALENASDRIEELTSLTLESEQSILRKRQIALQTYLEKRTVTPYYDPSWERRITGPYQILLMCCPEVFPQNFMEDCQESGWVPCTMNSMFYHIGQEMVHDSIISIIKQAEDHSTEYFLPYLVFSLSETKETWEALPDAYHECCQAQKYYFYLSRQSYIPYSMIRGIKPMTLKALEPHFDRLQEALKLGAEKKTFEQLNFIHKLLLKDMNVHPAIVNQLFYDFLLMSMDTLQASNKDSGITDYVKNITLQKMQNLPTLELIYQYIATQLNHYFNHIESLYLQSNERIVSRVKEFCRQNYNTDCSLDDISSSVYISKNYLAQVFKEKTGMSLWNYVTDLRVEKAKELLALAEVKATMVAELVGYKNASHFGRVFKERTGLTPKEYQQKVYQVS